MAPMKQKVIKQYLECNIKSWELETIEMKIGQEINKKLSQDGKTLRVDN